MGEKKRAAYIGFDVGKSAHGACAVDARGEVLFSRAVPNRPADIDRAIADAGRGAGVVVDQKRNIGALVVARARAAGNRVHYLPGTAMKRARDMYPVTAKTDEIDAEVIARTAAGMSWRACHGRCARSPQSRPRSRRSGCWPRSATSPWRRARAR